jgi:hypothetical protein
LLSAVCIEGFLVECLKQQVIEKNNTMGEFQARLKADFLNRISQATFRDFPELFRVVTGKPLRELVDDKTLTKGVRVLIDFRNGVAHARSTLLSSHDDDEEEREYELDGHYEKLELYFKKNRLRYGTESVFTDIVADHFAGLIQPYISRLMSNLPVSHTMNHLIKVAYHEMPELMKEYSS